ncbi:HEAT repeat domain-containing protein [Naasia lichenicola]|uniref:HEAT repeat domain-containing protein n=1 Tax=Naasia lichenicola TaxID=2565933 RepID=A0A4V3WSZ4_9MICO|nr:HEAT repeat domain-containing protein [Naasia lichenicola]THG30057.1 HEAT repeat domain-containing protein [Naasia lichenicola]
MTRTDDETAASRLAEALASLDSSARLQAALAAGTHPNPAYVAVLVGRCAIEPDFFVRDMLTWALVRHPVDSAVPPLLEELRGGSAQARSQALHTLSKIGDPRGWTAITTELLEDADDRVARSAWRAGVILSPDDAGADLAAALTSQLGRGDRELRKSLSRAFVDLGSVSEPVLEESTKRLHGRALLHALATLHLVRNADETFESAMFEAQHEVLIRDDDGA